MRRCLFHSFTHGVHSSWEFGEVPRNTVPVRSDRTSGGTPTATNVKLWITCCGLVTQTLEGRGFRIRISSMEGARSRRPILDCSSAVQPTGKCLWCTPEKEKERKRDIAREAEYIAERYVISAGILIQDHAATSCWMTSCCMAL